MVETIFGMLCSTCQKGKFYIIMSTVHTSKQ